jgi:hypothetical protein
MSATNESTDASRPAVVRNRSDVERLDGRPVEAVGQYQAIARPRKGPPTTDAPRDHAVLVLDDGTWLFLEPLGSPDAVRTADERRAFDGVPVCAAGTARLQMPAKGATLVAACIEDITSITAFNDTEHESSREP